MASIENELLGALSALAKACGNNPKTKDTDGIVMEGLLMLREKEKEKIYQSAQNLRAMRVVDTALMQVTEMVREEKNRIVPNCRFCENPCGNTAEPDFEALNGETETIKTLKRKLRKLMLEAAEHVQMKAGKSNRKPQMDFFYKALEILSYEMPAGDLIQAIEEAENLKKS